MRPPVSVIVARTTMGRVYHTGKHNRHQFCRPPCTASGCQRLDRCTQHTELYDSIVVSDDFGGKLPREFLVFDSRQCYPELVITFQVLQASG